MTYIPASELERTVLNYRSPLLLGKPCAIHINELCHALFQDPAAATRAAIIKSEEMAGKSLPWYPTNPAVDLQDLRCSILCSSVPELPVEYVQKTNPGFVCGWRGLITICAWAPTTLADFIKNKQEPKPGDVFRRWSHDHERYFDCVDFTKFGGQWDAYDYIEERFAVKKKMGFRGYEFAGSFEYVGTVQTEEATSGS